MTDHVKYQETLLRALNVLPAESEEEAYRFRNVRLAEKGFLPFDEAVGVYQPINIKVIQKQAKQIQGGRRPEAIFLPIPLNHLAFLEKGSRFSRALSIMSLDETFQQIQIEFAGLCNQIAAADQKPIHEREELREIVKKSCGYLEIGLERLAGKKTRLDDSQTAGYIKTYPLIDIFRLGYGLVVGLRQRAKQWQQQSWFANNRLALSFWDEFLVGVLGGLLARAVLGTVQRARQSVGAWESTCVLDVQIGKQSDSHVDQKKSRKKGCRSRVARVFRAVARPPIRRREP